MSDCILSDVEMTARKPHRCDHCLTLIEPGSRYQRTRQILEGEAGTFRSHLDCRAVPRDKDVLLVAGETYDSLAQANDSGCTFAEIADAIEQNWARL